MNRASETLALVVFIALLVCSTGCHPLTDGLSAGVADGLTAATSAFIEELAGALIGGVIPGGGE